METVYSDMYTYIRFKWIVVNSGSKSYSIEKCVQSTKYTQSDILMLKFGTMSILWIFNRKALRKHHIQYTPYTKSNILTSPDSMRIPDTSIVRITIFIVVHFQFYYYCCLESGFKLKVDFILFEVKILFESMKITEKEYNVRT